MEQAKPDSFTAYLEAKQRLKPSTTTAAGPTPLSLLFKLAEVGQMPLADLQAASGMAFGEFSETLKSLGASGYVSVSGDPGHEVAALTKLGEEVSRLAHPVEWA